MGGKGGSETRVEYAPNPVSEKIVSIFDTYLSPRLNTWAKYIPNPDVVNQGNYNYYKSLDNLYSDYLSTASNIFNTNKNIINEAYNTSVDKLNQAQSKADALPSNTATTFNEALNNATSIFNSVNNKNMLSLAVSGFLNTPLAQKQTADAFNTVINPILRDKASAVSNALQTSLATSSALADRFLSATNQRTAGLLGVNKDILDTKLQSSGMLKDTYNAWLNYINYPDTMIRNYLGVLSGASGGYTPVQTEHQSTASILGRAAGSAASTFAMASAAGLSNPATAALTIGSALLGGKR